MNIINFFFSTLLMIKINFFLHYMNWLVIEKK